MKQTTDKEKIEALVAFISGTVEKDNFRKNVKIFGCVLIEYLGKDEALAVIREVLPPNHKRLKLCYQDDVTVFYVEKISEAFDNGLSFDEAMDSVCWSDYAGSVEFIP